MKEEISLIDGSLIMDYAVAKLSRSIRLLSMYMMNDDLESANSIKKDIVENQLPLIQEKVIPYLKRDQETQLSSYPVIISGLDDNINRGINFYMNGYELYKKMDTLARFFVNLSNDDWYTICFYDENKSEPLSNTGRHYLNKNYNENMENLVESYEEMTKELNSMIEQYYVNNKYLVHSQYNIDENDLYANNMNFSLYYELYDSNIKNNEPYMPDIELNDSSFFDKENTSEYIDENNINEEITFGSNNNDVNYEENPSVFNDIEVVYEESVSNNISQEENTFSINDEDTPKTDNILNEYENDDELYDEKRYSINDNVQESEILQLNKNINGENNNNNINDSYLKKKTVKTSKNEDNDMKKKDIYGEINRGNCNFLNDYRVR